MGEKFRVPKPWDHESYHVVHTTEALDTDAKEEWRFEIKRTLDDPEWKLVRAQKVTTA